MFVMPPTKAYTQKDLCLNIARFLIGYKKRLMQIAEVNINKLECIAEKPNSFSILYGYQIKPQTTVPISKKKIPL